MEAKKDKRFQTEGQKLLVYRKGTLNQLEVLT